MHYPNIVLLHRRFGSLQDASMSVSVSMENVEYVIGEQRSCLTMLVCNALPKYCAPSLPILFRERASLVTVCIE
jgi:hypothetical protein